MSGSGETADAIKYDKVTTTIYCQGEEGKEKNTGKRRVNQSRRRT